MNKPLGPQNTQSRVVATIENAISIGLLSVELPKRSQMSAVKSPETSQKYKIAVVRNYAAETVTRWVGSFLRLAGIESHFVFSDYDDSVASMEDDKADLMLVMLDYRRYTSLDSEFVEWFSSRILDLRNHSTSAMIVIGADDTDDASQFLNQQLEASLSHLPGVLFIVPNLGATWVEPSAEAAQSPFFGSRAIEIARNLAWQWIPLVMDRLVRLVILDLDNTLYKGVLAEDGLTGLQITASHKRNLRSLKAMSDKGLLLAISSKNESDDVDALIDSNLLSPLSRGDFLSIEASWRSKSTHVAAILDKANFGPEHVVMFDDNPGELAELLHSFPELHVALATSPEVVEALLEWYPGMYRPEGTSADRFRLADLTASQARNEYLHNTAGQVAQDLAVIVTVNYQPLEHLSRLAQLSVKTSQFNTNLARLTEVELHRRASATPSMVASFELKDRFSDSGIVGSVAGEVVENVLVIDEIAISCRALGRGIEDIILNEILKELAIRCGASSIEVLAVQGPRNGPALSWLERSAKRISDTSWSWAPSRHGDTDRAGIEIVDSTGHSELEI